MKACAVSILYFRKLTYLNKKIYITLLVGIYLQTELLLSVRDFG